MANHRFKLFAAAVLSAALAGEAAAGCCGAPYMEGPSVTIGPPREIYVVNKGPVLSGPGPYLRPEPEPVLGGYPYVGYVYSGYPYGLQDSGAYFRGAYGAGYSYGQPAPYRMMRSYRRAR